MSDPNPTREPGPPVARPLLRQDGPLRIAGGALLGWWRAAEHTLSLRHVDTARRERFYWAAALIAFALGTAAGHSVVDAIPALVTWSVLLAAIAVAWRGFRLDAAVAFWAAYVLTRPFGTSVALLVIMVIASGRIQP